MKNPTFRKYRTVEFETYDDHIFMSDDLRKDLETMDPVMIRILERHLAECIRKTQIEITEEREKGNDNPTY